MRRSIFFSIDQFFSTEKSFNQSGIRAPLHISIHVNLYIIIESSETVSIVGYRQYSDQWGNKTFLNVLLLFIYQGILGSCKTDDIDYTFGLLKIILGLILNG